MSMNEPIKLVWGNSDLIIYAKHRIKELEKVLKYVHKYMIKDPNNYRGQIIKRKTVDVFNLYYDDQQGVIYQTHQGLIDLVCKTCSINKIAYRIQDNRTKLPKARLDRMHGFRFNQEQVLTKALLCNRSGIIKAPTRYGKTVLITNTINAYPELKIGVLGPGLEVLKATKETVLKYCPDREVKLLCSGSRDKYESDDITICSFDSMHKLDKSSFDLLLIDEPHAAVTDSRAPQLAEFSKARKLGYGATTEDRWSGNDILITGLIGPILSETTYLECVKLGALCPIHVYMIVFKYKPNGYSLRNTAYNNYMYKNPKFCKLVSDICNNYIPEDFQTLVFISNEKQAEYMAPYINNSFIAMDKLFKNKSEREEVFNKLKNNEIKRCLCSNIYSTGVTIDDIRAELNCCGGGGNIMAIQKPGRLAEIKPNKNEGIMIDFLFMPEGKVKSNTDNCMYIDSMSRLKKYQEKGYQITIINNIENELKLC